MKKILLSAFVILIFIGYVIHKRLEPIPTVGVVVPSPLGTNNSSEPTTNDLSIPTPMGATTTSFKDGQYIGPSTDAFYGNIQVKVTIQGGKITDVVFLDYPQDRNTSIEINTQAMPILKEEAIQNQNANVDIVSGATQTSLAFIKSLQAALNQAQ